MNDILKMFYEEEEVIHEYDLNPALFMTYKYGSTNEIRKMLSNNHNSLEDKSMKYKTKSYGKYFKAL